MKLITWNCNGAFRRKYEHIDALGADVLVIQECEDPAQSDKSYREWAGDYLWTGYGKNKGIGIFPRKNQPIERLDWPDGGYELFLPARIGKDLDLIGVWTQHAKPARYAYVGQLWHYLELNKHALSESSVILGDFNSNAIWDRPRHPWKHSDCVASLEGLGYCSVYHHARAEPQGMELEPTFYLQRNLEKPFHIDFAFAQRNLISKDGLDVELGKPVNWIELSDHMPLILNL